MKLKENDEKYGKLARIIHWLTLILVTIIIPLGLYLANAEYTDAINIFRVQIIFGILVFILTIIRIIWSILDNRPDYPEDIVGIQLIAYRVNHYLLYILPSFPVDQWALWSTVVLLKHSIPNFRLDV